MRVAELSERLAITPDTVRFYTRIGFLRPRKNPDNGYKEYGAEDLQRLKFILSARGLGFSVDDVGQILREADQGKSPCHATRTLMATRLRESEQRFREMLALRNKMQAALTSWETVPDCPPSGHTICHLIEAFSEQEWSAEPGLDSSTEMDAMKDETEAMNKVTSKR
ncbi:MerR family transcriptional regulator [Ketobacter sp.]|uniref:MerR family transcriptional regulator n=1 Tax=Ketobacter sp. TaxID=2083498 RepID=UPI000F113993|nr:MerR family transcriptional regulator [Ketobacter sp.]RLT96827.1 MAG: MerR family transcriptional regulator [Ketobacter sp.]